MSQELTTIPASALPLALSAPQQEIDEVAEAVAMNADNGGMSELDIPRITIAPGAFKTPTAKGTTLAERIVGVVVYIRHVRTYYKSKDQGNRPPDCSSKDCITGRGDPGGRCTPLVDLSTGKVSIPGCPLAAFESATTPDGRQGKGQACKETKQLFILRGDSLMPEILSIPPTSLVAARKFFNFVAARFPYPKALISITVSNQKNTQGQEYGTAAFDLVRKLTSEEAQRMMTFHKMCEKFLKTTAINEPADAE
jgi:hypothetical protein